MIKTTKELKKKIKKELNKKAEELVDELNLTSKTEDFTIDTIEDIMTSGLWSYYSQRKNIKKC